MTSDRQVILPEELARELALTPGNDLVIERENGKLVLKSFQQVVREVQAEFRRLRGPDIGQPSIVDELIQERREEARRDDEELEQWLAKRR